MRIFHFYGALLASCLALISVHGCEVADSRIENVRSETGDSWPEEGFMAPDFSASDLSGKEQSIRKYRGSVLVLHFWASWCPYCRGEIPKLLKVNANLSSKGVRILSIGMDEDLAKLRRFIAGASLPYPVVADAQQAVSFAPKYHITGIPVTFIIKPDGRIASRFDGPTDISGAVRQVLAQLPSNT